MRYWAIELLTAVLFALAFWRITDPFTGPTLAVFPAWIFISFLIIATFTDIDHWIIPDRISIGGMFVGFVLALIYPVGLAEGNPLADPIWPFGIEADLYGRYQFMVDPRFIPIINSILGAGTGFAMLWSVGAIGAYIFKREAMGWGDLKLVAMFGAFAGPVDALMIFLIACFIGSFVGGLTILISFIRRNRKTRKAIAQLEGSEALADKLVSENQLAGLELEVIRSIASASSSGKSTNHLPFGPWLSLAALVIYLYGEPIGEWLYWRMSTGWGYQWPL